MTIPFPQAPEAFTRAATAVRTARLRTELNYREIPAPENVAPYAIAVGAGINPGGQGVVGPAADIDSRWGAGRLILLYDPEFVPAWEGHFRFVCYAQAEMDQEIGADPLLSEVAWSWLVDALHTRQAAALALGGAVTTTSSTGFGTLASRGAGTEVQLRASWSPQDTNFAAHVAAWSELLCLLSGLPQEEGVVPFPTGRQPRFVA